MLIEPKHSARIAILEWFTDGINMSRLRSRSAYVRVGIYVDPHDTSVEALSEQVSDIIGTGPEDFDDELPTVCAECGCEVPYRLAFAATVRKQAHKNDEEAAMAYRHALAGIVHSLDDFLLRQRL